MLGETFPFAVDANGIWAAGDLWLIFTLEILVLGTFLVWVAREPLKHRNLVWLVIRLELIRGALDDMYPITQGYDAAGYAVFIVIHILIVRTGILFVRQVNTQNRVRSAALETS